MLCCSHAYDFIITFQSSQFDMPVNQTPKLTRRRKIRVFMYEKVINFMSKELLH
jgi:hypothetical protein